MFYFERIYTFKEGNLLSTYYFMPRGKVTLEKLPCEQYLQRFVISHVCLRAKWVGGRKARKIPKRCRNHPSQGSYSYFTFPLEHFNNSTNPKQSAKI